LTIGQDELLLPFNLGGHVHNGGVNVITYQDKKSICDAKATYSKAPAMKSAKVSRDVAHGNEDMPHIEDMSTCNSLAPFSTGQQFWIDAKYDFEQYPRVIVGVGLRLWGLRFCILLFEMI
jgi:hypothetical protein